MVTHGQSNVGYDLGQGRQEWRPRRPPKQVITLPHCPCQDPVPGSGFSPYGRAVAGHTAPLFALTGGHGRNPRRTACEKTGTPPHTLRPYRPYPPGLTSGACPARPARRQLVSHRLPGPRMTAEAAKAPHQTAAGLSYASGPASSADLTAGQPAQVKVPGERTRESALDTSPPANKTAAVSPMGGRGGAQRPQPAPLIEADSDTARSGRRGRDLEAPKRAAVPHTCHT